MDKNARAFLKLLKVTVKKSPALKQAWRDVSFVSNEPDEFRLAIFKAIFDTCEPNLRASIRRRMNVVHS